MNRFLVALVEFLATAAANKSICCIEILRELDRTNTAKAAIASLRLVVSTSAGIRLEEL
jgi:hypothetical protein